MILNKYKRIVLCVDIILAIILIPLLYNYIPLNHNNKTFYIPSGEIDTVIKTLEVNGYSLTFIDKFMLQFDQIPQEGWYSVKKDKDGRFFFFKNLYRHKTKTMDIVVFAGETANELVSRLANDMKLDKEKLYQHYKCLAQFQEADIIAKRYTIACNADENCTIQYLFHDSKKRLDTFMDDHFSKKPDPLTFKVFLTIASIIQKESNSIKEMPLISSVIHNRLKKKMRLQMDSTLNYGEYSHVIVTPERIKNDNSDYNTYKHKGLPPTPLSTVTIEALKAAMLPQESDYLFFMLGKTGEHNFTETYGDHLKNIKAFRLYQKKKKALLLRNKNNENNQSKPSSKKL